jgi:hypothetical protein
MLSVTVNFRPLKYVHMYVHVKRINAQKVVFHFTGPWLFIDSVQIFIIDIIYLNV